MPVFAFAPTPPRPALRQLGSRALLACSVLLGVGCSGGYPTDDEPLLSPADMTQTQRLAAMNDIGRAGDLERRWEYALLERCVLNIIAQQADAAQQLLRVPLASVGFTLHTDVVGKTHDVGATPLGSLTAEPRPVLEGSTWVDAVQMRSLLQHLQVGCLKASPAAVG